MRAILTYHSLDDSESPISVSPAAFRAHIRFFAPGQLRLVPLGAITSENGSGDAIAISFDDASRNFATIAAPLLHEYGLPATLFIVSGHDAGINRWRGRPHSVAYPHGRVTDVATRRVRATYRRAVTTELRPVEPNEDPFLLPCPDMFYFRDAGALELWRTARFRRRSWLRAQGRRRRRLAFRGVRA